jgi:hypothetical protein
MLTLLDGGKAWKPPLGARRRQKEFHDLVLTPQTLPDAVSFNVIADQAPATASDFH